MVDTQVLSFALAIEPARDEKTKHLQRDSAALVGSLAQVRVCAIVELELRRLPPAIVAKLEASGIFAQHSS